MTRNLAVKAFIIKDNKVLLVRRSASEKYSGTWDNPGGRLEGNEHPYDGLKREVYEETKLKISIGKPIGVAHFSRDDGYYLTLIYFICTLESGTIELSHEHDAYEWVTFDKLPIMLGTHVQDVVEAFLDDFAKK